MSSPDDVKGVLNIEGREIPIEVVGLSHEEVQFGLKLELRDGVQIFKHADWAVLYGILRRPTVQSILVTESLPIYVVIEHHFVDFNQTEYDYFRCDMDSWAEIAKIGRFEKPAEWSEEGF